MASYPPFPSIEQMRTMSSSAINDEYRSWVRKNAGKCIHRFAKIIKTSDDPMVKSIKLSKSEVEAEFTTPIPPRSSSEDPAWSIFRDVVHDMGVIFRAIAPGYNVRITSVSRPESSEFTDVFVTWK